jgi:hypothetical protein
VEKVVERKLPGSPIPREQLVRQYEDWRWRNVNVGPGQAAIFDLLVPKPEDTYQWRIQLNCGCIRDVVTHGDALERLVQRSDKYYHWHSEEQLPDGQWLCHDPKCPKHRLTGGPVRDIVEWRKRHDDLHHFEPMEIDGERIGKPHDDAVWDVLLSCGHLDTKFTKPDWKPEDGPVHPKPTNEWRGLEEILPVVAKDQDDEAYWRRIYAEKHPEPALFKQCQTCANMRSVVAYERVGWVKPKPKPPKAPTPPKPPSRRNLQTRLRKLEAEAEQLREQLKKLEE